MQYAPTTSLLPHQMVVVKTWEADLSIRLDNQGIPSLQTGSVPLHTPLARHVLKPVPTNSNPVSQVYIAVDPVVSPVTVTLPSSIVSEGQRTENHIWRSL